MWKDPPPLLAVRMEDGAVSQGMRSPLEAAKAEEADFLRELPEGMNPAGALRPDSDLQNGTITSFAL